MATKLFVASIGNPAPYEKTLHSAGHVLLRALADHLQCGPLKSDRQMAHGLTSEAILPGDPDTHITLWQSQSYMNKSGPGLVQSYRKWLARNSDSSKLMPPPDISNVQNYRKVDVAQSPELFRPRLNLVLLHDEKDVVPGRFQVRYGGAERSSRGHNGVKSVVEELVRAGLLRPDKNDEAKTLAKRFKVKLKRAQQAAAAANESGEKKFVEPEKDDDDEDPDLVLPVLCRAQIGIGSQTNPARSIADYVLQQMGPSLEARTCAQAETVSHFLQKMRTSPYTPVSSAPHRGREVKPPS